MNKATKRILIIEDDEPFEMWIRQSLAGAEFFVVQSIEEALKHLEANRFDVVIADMSLLGQWPKTNIRRLRVACSKWGAVMAGITGSIYEMPEGFDATAYKINLNTTHAIEALIYSAIRARNTKSLAEQSTEAVTAVARLLQAKA